MPETTISKKQDFAATVSAVLIVLAAIGAIAYLVTHIVSVFMVVFALLAGMFGAAVINNTKTMQRLSTRKWMASKWMWMALLVVSAGLYWLRGENALFIIFTLTFLQLFQSPSMKKKDTSRPA